MFVDEVDIHVAAGHGGRGAMSFRREKFVPRGGPNGGDGGPGGSVFVTANANLNTLLNFRFQKEFAADRGGHGEGSNRTGRKGNDVHLEVPVGPSFTRNRATS
jgi:GTP-binding protein